MDIEPLPHRLFGSTDIKVSPLGLGTVKLGRNKNVKYPNNFTIPNNREASDLLSLAYNLGINLIDTAPAYGNSEQRLGELLRGQRNKWVICSKVGEDYHNGVSTFNFSAKHTRFSIERSLSRLNTDHIEIVLVHSNGSDLDIIHNEEVLDELYRLKKKGLIGAFGMSTKSIEGGLQAAEKTDAVMISYNLDYKDEQEVIDFCFQNSKGLLIKKGFSSGHLRSDQGDPVAQTMDLIFSQPGVSALVIGTIDQQHLRNNVQAASRSLIQLKT